jgi:hypothetical protein
VPVSRPARPPTHHFATHDDLVGEAFLHYLGVGEAKIRTVIEQHRRVEDPGERLRSILATIVGRDFAGVLVRAEYELLLRASPDAELAAEARAWENRLVGALAEALEGGGSCSARECSSDPAQPRPRLRTRIDARPHPHRFRLPSTHRRRPRRDHAPTEPAVAPDLARPGSRGRQLGTVTDEPCRGCSKALISNAPLIPEQPVRSTDLRRHDRRREVGDTGASPHVPTAVEAPAISCDSVGRRSRSCPMF